MTEEEISKKVRNVRIALEILQKELEDPNTLPERKKEIIGGLVEMCTELSKLEE